MVAHARADHPGRSRGLIRRTEGSDRPERFIAMLTPNGRRRLSGSTPPSNARCALARRCRRRRNRPSTTSPPRPRPTNKNNKKTTRSRTDISYASEPNAIMSLVLPAIPTKHALRSYRSSTGSSPRPVKSVEQYLERPRPMSVTERSPPSCAPTHGGEKRVTATGATFAGSSSATSTDELFRDLRAPSSTPQSRQAARFVNITSTTRNVRSQAAGPPISDAIGDHSAAVAGR